MRRIVVKLANGTTQQFDIIGDHCFSEGALGLEYRRMGENFVPYMYFNLGFAFTECVNLASFIDYTTYQNLPAFHYQDASTEAWISTESRLPVGAVLIGSVKTSYQYQPVPDANAIVLSPAEQKMLEEQKKAEEIYKNLR